ncbi:GNAT family N-acetyltransferase [Flavisolibacter tropicus]|nr:GNAT family N-acetyltransferase [Flavisolibacter tropicus]
MMTLIETDRLIVSDFNLDDAAFIIKLVNSPGWLQYIGDRNIKSPEEARQYLENGPLKSYKQWGFGLYRVALKNTNTAIGMCGLIKREVLDGIDIGFALLPAYEGQGYAYEAAKAVLDYAAKDLGMKRMLAITMVDNAASIKLLQKLGLRFEKMIRLNDEDLALLAMELGKESHIVKEKE